LKLLLSREDLKPTLQVRKLKRKDKTEFHKDVSINLFVMQRYAHRGSSEKVNRAYFKNVIMKIVV
jgi:hypothetical protein